MKKVINIRNKTAVWLRAMEKNIRPNSVEISQNKGNFNLFCILIKLTIAIDQRKKFRLKVLNGISII